jgi:hypothetical protein
VKLKLLPNGQKRPLKTYQTNRKTYRFKDNSVYGDRRGLETRISSDVFPFLFNHLNSFGDVSKISIFLYTTGGITISGFSLVNLIREFCNELDVIIPFKALSTGTLIALGANRIIMSRMGQLGPVDPSVNHPLAPVIPHPQNPNIRVGIPVNVEDVVSYFDLARREAKIHSDAELTDIFKVLSNGIHPLALGAVNRARDQIRFLAKMLLSYHIQDASKIDTIIKILTAERFSHEYIIGRKEAKNVIGLNIQDVSQELNELIMKLQKEYSILLKFDSPYLPEVELGADQQTIKRFCRGIIESDSLTHVYTTQREIKRVMTQQPGIPISVPQYFETTLQEGWVEDNSV